MPRRTWLRSILTTVMVMLPSITIFSFSFRLRTSMRNLREFGRRECGSIAPRVTRVATFSSGRERWMKKSTQRADVSVLPCGIDGNSLSDTTKFFSSRHGSGPSRDFFVHCVYVFFPKLRNPAAEMGIDSRLGVLWEGKDVLPRGGSR